jgi:Right handed beta helix region
MKRHLLLGGKFFCNLLLLVLATSTPIMSAGTTWFVATSGSDSYTCTQAQNSSTPKRTILAALACVGTAGTEAGAGNVVQVAPGSYSESLVDKIPSGSGSSSQFTLKCATDFACTNSLPTAYPARNVVGFNILSHWITIRGFVFDGGMGIRLSAYNAGDHHDITFLNNEIKNSPNGMGIEASGSSYIRVIGNKIHDVGSICTGLGPGYCHGIYVSNYTDHWWIEGNEIYKSTSYGITVYGDSGPLPHDFTIKGNNLHHNGTPGKNGAGINTYGPGHIIFNNVSYSNAYEGILLRAASDVLVYNNTTYKNGASGVSMEYGSAVSCRNNLSISNQGGITGCNLISNNITSGTAAVNFANADAGDFKLILGSPAIGAGINLSPTVVDDFAGNSRPSCCAYDIGAYQYTSSTSTSTITKPATNLRIVP